MAYHRDRTSARRRPRTAASRRRTNDKRSGGGTKVLPYLLTAGVLAAVVGVYVYRMQANAKAEPVATQAQQRREAAVADTGPKVEVDNRQFSGGYPSRAEDLYREGHTLLNQAFDPKGGVKDPDKVREALKKLDASVDAYFVLEKEHPNNKVISERINTINKLRMLAHKSYTIKR